MSHEYSANKNNQRKHPKVHFQQYLYNSTEPRDVASRDTPAELEAELLEDSYIMRKDFRHIADKIRHSY